MTENPPPDEVEAVEDDSAVSDDRVVWRRLPLLQMPPDENHPGHRRLSEGGFSDSSDGSGMSVHLVTPGEDPITYLTRVERPNDGLAELTVRDIRAAGFGLVHDPTEIDPLHYLISGRKSSSKKRRLFKIARLVIEAK